MGVTLYKYPVIPYSYMYNYWNFIPSVFSVIALLIICKFCMLLVSVNCFDVISTFWNEQGNYFFSSLEWTALLVFDQTFTTSKIIYFGSLQIKNLRKDQGSNITTLLWNAIVYLSAIIIKWIYVNSNGLHMKCTNG